MLCISSINYWFSYFEPCCLVKSQNMTGVPAVVLCNQASCKFHIRLYSNKRSFYREKEGLGVGKLSNFTYSILHSLVSNTSTSKEHEHIFGTKIPFCWRDKHTRARPRVTAAPRVICVCRLAGSWCLPFFDIFWFNIQLISMSRILLT